MLDLQDYGFHPAMKPDNIKGIPARITAVYKERYELICQYGQVFGRLKSSIYYGNKSEEFPTTGDYVIIDYNQYGDSQITKTLERKSVFIRNTVSRDRVGHTDSVKPQVVAANFDYVFIMQSLNWDLNIKRLERYVALAWQSGAMPVIVLTKADLVDDCSIYINDIQRMIPGVDVHALSAKDGYGIGDLNEYLKPRKTIVFLGSSGVGKSSLVNVLADEEIMEVNEIREDDSKGRHTTTRRQLIMLDSGVMIIDTPGMREIGMWDANIGLEETFADIEQFLGRCKFRDCQHKSEPGCLVKLAIETGELSKERWNNYLKLKSESKFVNDKAEYMREKNQWHKDLSKWGKNNKKK